MSDPRRPFGDTNDDHDLRQDTTTDAPDDADALDALLNEIASGSGTPGPRHDAPNARTDDAASVLDTAAAFHRQVETAQGRDSRAAGPDPQLWETIMARTASPTVPMPGTLPRASSPYGHVHNADLSRKRSATQRQNRWNMVANLGLVAAILLMAFGVWRIAGSPGLPGNGDGNGSLPSGHFAMQPATPGGTPEATGEAPAVIPPVATPTPTTPCDLSNDIPIINGTDSLQWPGTTVVLTSTGEVVLTCPEEPEGEVLATTAGQTSVAPVGWPQEWPGAVTVLDKLDDPVSSRTRVVSLITGDIVDFGSGRSESEASGPQQAPGSPWVVGRAPGDTADVQILDLRTMQTRLLSEIAGATLPTHGGYLLSSSDDGSTLVLSLMRHQYPSAGEASLVTSELPGDLLVLRGTLDAATWLTAPDDFPPVVGFEVSPDGQHVALHGAKGSMDEREHIWSIVSLDDGAEIVRSATVTTGPEPSEGIWIDAGFVYIDGSELVLLPSSPNLPEQAIYSGNGPLTDLRETTDASVVLVEQRWTDDLATMVASAQTPTTYSIDVTTGEGGRFAGVDITTFTGVDVSANTHPWSYPTRFLVMFDYQLEPRNAITYRVVDAVTGVTVATLDDVPLNESGYTGYPMLGPRSVVSSADGETEVIAFDTQHIYLMQVIDGEPTVRQLESPPGLPSEYPLMAQMFLSPDGSLLSLMAEGDEARTRWLLPLDGESDAWVTVENETVGSHPGHIFFIRGTGD